MLKLYVLIRDDISEAQQAVQAGHAVAKFGLDYPERFKAWQEDSNTLVYLSITDIDSWKTVLKDGKFGHSVFHEPQLPHYIKGWGWSTRAVDTAIAVAPNWFSQYVLFKDLPLAMRPKKKWWQR